MDHAFIINKLSENLNTFRSLLENVTAEEFMWKSNPEKWCLLEIVCHLHDEEHFDFRARTDHILENIQKDLPPIDPVGWVTSKNYIDQNYNESVEKFLAERKKSAAWLSSLKDPKWKNEYKHLTFGIMSAEFFLTNWLAHDYLHIRQITALKFNYLKHVSGIDPLYAGEW